MSRSWQGFFGKIPTTGDFVQRGLPPGIRRQFDPWLSTHLALRKDGWPEGGMRGLVWLGDVPTLFCAVPSQDSAHRRFPLTAVTDGSGVSFETAEAWCDHFAPGLSAVAAGDAALETFEAQMGPEADLPRKADSGETAIWVRGGQPRSVSPENIDAFFSSG
ncbi:MAG: TagF domain-containing protein [Pseudomonadota bacterium]